jgi:hypothetical protein
MYIYVYICIYMYIYVYIYIYNIKDVEIYLDIMGTIDQCGSLWSDRLQMISTAFSYIYVNIYIHIYIHKYI